jgi:hypothetical protein
VHDRLPRGLSPTDHEAGWQSSLAKRAALVEAVHRTGDDWPPDTAAPIKKARTP